MSPPATSLLRRVLVFDRNTPSFTACSWSSTTRVVGPGDFHVPLAVPCTGPRPPAPARRSQRLGMRATWRVFIGRRCGVRRRVIGSETDMLARSELLPAFAQGGTYMRKASKGLTAAMAAVTVMTLAVPATAATRTSAKSWSCNYGDVCVYSKANGRGRKCEWSVGDPDWRRGSVRCSFQLPRSIWVSSGMRVKGVRFYGAANYKQPLYLIKSGEGKNVNSDGGGFTVRSHRLVL